MPRRDQVAGAALDPIAPGIEEPGFGRAGVKIANPLERRGITGPFEGEGDGGGE